MLKEDLENILQELHDEVVICKNSELITIYGSEYIHYQRIYIKNYKTDFRPNTTNQASI